jgi:hypothetical protein
MHLGEYGMKDAYVKHGMYEIFIWQFHGENYMRKLTWNTLEVDGEAMLTANESQRLILVKTTMTNLVP